MKKMKNVVATTAILSALAGLSAPAAHAEVAATVGAGNMYYWRGMDLGNGAASVWGDLKYSESGFYTGAWGGSGDGVGGQELDLYLGYGGAIDDFKYDLSVWNYVYPSKLGFNEDGDLVTMPVPAGDASEAVLMLGYGPVAVTYYKNIAGATSYSYVTLAATIESFTLKYGKHMDSEDFLMPDGTAHLDLTYAYNDKVSFTLGKIIDDADGAVSDEAKFVVGFTLPIE